LTADDALDRHPQTPRAATWQDTAHAYLRVERQLIVPLGTLASDGTALMLFFIRMYVYPMTRLDTTQRAVLAAAVSDMSEPMRRYKGLLGHEPRILELLSAS
jgi:quinol monooxygenase YgiN